MSWGSYRCSRQRGVKNMIGRLGLIGDIHAEDELLERILRFLARSSVRNVFAVGDVADGIGSLERCRELLVAHQVLTVRGNHDRWLVDGTLRELPDAMPVEALSDASREFLRSLPAMAEILTPHGLALLCHGLGTNDMAELKPDDEGYALSSNLVLQNLLAQKTYAFVLNGHTHQAMVRHLGGLTIINAGTLRRGDRPCLAVVDFEQGFAELWQFDAGQMEPRAVGSFPLLVGQSR
jgi:predicted phosphodiesterase